MHDENVTTTGLWLASPDDDPAAIARYQAFCQAPVGARQHLP
jgi:hypothetical protein